MENWGALQSFLYTCARPDHYVEIMEMVGTMKLDWNLGLCALIEILEEPLLTCGKGTDIVVPISKWLTPEQHKKFHQGGHWASSIYLVPVDAIHFPIANIADMGGQPGDFLFVCPTSDWAEGFRDYRSICHRDK